MVRLSCSYHCSDNSDYFNLKSIGESLGKAQTADVIIGLARSPEKKQNKTASLLILKNRVGEDGITIPIYLDTAYVKIETITSSMDSKMNNMAQNIETKIMNDNIGIDGI